MERNLALELVRVTEAAALAAARWMGKGSGRRAERAARSAVELVLKSVRMTGRVVIGNAGGDSLLGEFKPGEDVPVVDVAIDVLQSTASVAFGRPNSISVIAVSEKGTFFEPPIPYMDKIAVGPEAAGCIDIRASTLDNLVNIADAKRCYVEDLTVCILDRERHQELTKEIRDAGARILLIPDGDMAAAVATAIPGSGIDVLMGIGGSAEGVLSAAALKCVRGDMQARMYVGGDDEAAALKHAGFGRKDRVLKLNDLVAGRNAMFAATGVTDSGFVEGVQFVPGGAVTHSVVMRSRSGTVRFIRAEHHFDRKPNYR